MSSIPQASTLAPAADLLRPETQAQAGDATSFPKLVMRLLEATNRDQLEAEAQARQMAEGRGDVVETMIAINRADLSLRLTVQLRNRALEAYQELMRIQV